MMQINYALSHAFVVFESTIAIRNRKKCAQRVFRLSLPVLGLLIVFSLFRSPRPQLLSKLPPLLFVVLLWTFMLWGSPWWFARTQFVKLPSAQESELHRLTARGLAGNGIQDQVPVRVRKTFTSLDGN